MEHPAGQPSIGGDRHRHVEEILEGRVRVLAFRRHELVAIPLAGAPHPPTDVDHGIRAILCALEFEPGFGDRAFVGARRRDREEPHERAAPNLLVRHRPVRTRPSV
jgi:hypothetical protein